MMLRGRVVYEVSQAGDIPQGAGSTVLMKQGKYLTFCSRNGSG